MTTVQTIEDRETGHQIAPVVHTPGPWKAERADVHGDEDDADENRWAVLTDGRDRDYFIASIENGMPGDTLKTEEANAKLMAAAPELLAACRLAQKWLANCVPVVDLPGEKPLPVVTAAIEKATGLVV